jgi:hypothetical protein
VLKGEEGAKLQPLVGKIARSLKGRRVENCDHRSFGFDRHKLPNYCTSAASQGKQPNTSLFERERNVMESKLLGSEV